MSLRPELLPDQLPKLQQERFRTVIFNNDYTPMDVVVMILMQATGCDADEAAIEMWEAHHFGQANVHFSSQIECKRAAKLIESVGVKTEVLPEWND